MRDGKGHAHGARRVGGRVQRKGQCVAVGHNDVHENGQRSGDAVLDGCLLRVRQVAHGDHVALVVDQGSFTRGEASHGPRQHELHVYHVRGFAVDFFAGDGPAPHLMHQRGHIRRGQVVASAAVAHRRHDDVDLLAVQNSVGHFLFAYVGHEGLVLSVLFGDNYVFSVHFILPLPGIFQRPGSQRSRRPGPALSLLRFARSAPARPQAPGPCAPRRRCSASR